MRFNTLFNSTCAIANLDQKPHYLTLSPIEKSSVLDKSLLRMPSSPIANRYASKVSPDGCQRHTNDPRFCAARPTPSSSEFPARETVRVARRAKKCIGCLIDLAELERVHQTIFMECPVCDEVRYTYYERLDRAQSIDAERRSFAPHLDQPPSKINSSKSDVESQRAFTSQSDSSCLNQQAPTASPTAEPGGVPLDDGMHKSSSRSLAVASSDSSAPLATTWYRNHQTAASSRTPSSNEHASKVPVNHSQSPSTRTRPSLSETAPAPVVRSGVTSLPGTPASAVAATSKDIENSVNASINQTSVGSLSAQTPSWSPISPSAPTQSEVSKVPDAASPPKPVGVSSLFNVPPAPKSKPKKRIRRRTRNTFESSSDSEYEPPSKTSRSTISPSTRAKFQAVPTPYPPPFTQLEPLTRAQALFEQEKREFLFGILRSGRTNVNSSGKAKGQDSDEQAKTDENMSQRYGKSQHKGQAPKEYRGVQVEETSSD